MSVDHYENFPVASLLFPARLRPAVTAIYAFARTADDLADEGSLSTAERLRRLAGYRAELDRIGRGEASEEPLFQALQQQIASRGLPLEPFYDLLDAFCQDVVKDRYTSFDELLDYCRRSANPVGRLLLHLFAAVNAENLRHSDAICTALQLIDHWQDVGIDLDKGPRGRIYLPQEDLDRFGVTESALSCRVASAEFRALMRCQLDRARALMTSGAALGRVLPGRLGIEIRAIIAGGLAIIEKIEASGYDVFHHRPVLSAADWPRLFLRAVFA
ncbi:MAG: squalene synthase HpnC [Rhodocyclaceae bacterium]